MKVKITSDGEVHGGRVITETGEDLSGCVHGIVWQQHARGHATAELYIRVVPIEVVGEVTRWHGLDEIPTAVLEDELDKRRQQP